MVSYSRVCGDCPCGRLKRKGKPMARTSRLKVGGDAYYHVSSRVTGQQFLLAKAEVKRAMLDALERSAAFSGVNIAGFCIMDNHFHVLCQVPKVDAGTVPDEAVLERVGRLCGEKRLGTLKDELVDAQAVCADDVGEDTRRQGLCACNDWAVRRQAQVAKSEGQGLCGRDVRVARLPSREEGVGLASRIIIRDIGKRHIRR